MKIQIRNKNGDEIYKIKLNIFKNIIQFTKFTKSIYLLF